MNVSLMIDNWTLQDVEGLLQSGFTEGDAPEISISADRSGHSFNRVAAGVFQIEALLTLLSNIVCFGALKVDKRFVDTWQRDGGFLHPLEHTGVIQVDDYQPLGDDLPRATGIVLDQLCFTESLKQAMERTKEQWAATKTSDHFSSLVWGGAGMLARSHLTSTPYFGHPARRRLFSQVPALHPNAGSVQRFDTFISTQRAKMFRYRAEQFGGSIGHIVLPAIPVQVIQEAKTRHDLIPVAFEMRDQHADLREWLGEYQRAIDEEEEGKQIKFEQTLTKVGQSLQVRYGAEKAGSMGISINTSFVRVEAQRPWVDGVLNRFGIRSTLSSLLLTSPGQKALVKLVGMFADPRSPEGHRVLTACQARFAHGAPAGA